MHNSNFVVAIKANGKVLREQAELVTLPFGTEFTVLVKNLNSVRAQFTVSIDGQDATEGCRLILPANGSIELERFIRNGNLSAGQRFRFIERTAAIEQHKGVGAEDGLVRVECWRERIEPKPVYVPVVHQHYDTWWPNRPPYYPSHWCGVRGGNIVCNSTRSSGVGGSSSRGFRSFDSAGSRETLRSASCNFMQASASSASNQQTGTQTMDWGNGQNSSAATPQPTANDAGITVPGSHSSQSFMSMTGFPLETPSTVLTLKLRGEVAGRPVAKPVMVSVKLTCGTCGQPCKSSAQYCHSCGAALTRY